MDKNGSANAGAEQSQQTLCPACGTSTALRKPLESIRAAGECKPWRIIMMYLCVRLKVCEGCGSLWFQSEQGGIYCVSCVRRLKDFPAPGSRRRCRKKRVEEERRIVATGGVA